MGQSRVHVHVLCRGCDRPARVPVPRVRQGQSEPHLRGGQSRQTPGTDQLRVRRTASNLRRQHAAVLQSSSLLSHSTSTTANILLHDRPSTSSGNPTRRKLLQNLWDCCQTNQRRNKSSGRQSFWWKCVLTDLNDSDGLKFQVLINSKD